MGGFSKLKKLFSKSPRHGDTDTDEQRRRHHVVRSRQQDGRSGGEQRAGRPTLMRPLSYGGGYVPGYPQLWQYTQGVPYYPPSDSNRHSHYQLPVRHSAWYYPPPTATLETGRRQEGWRLSPVRSSASPPQMWRSNYYLPSSPGVTSPYQTMAHMQGLSCK